MKTPIPHQLRRLDEALLALLDERRRMLDELEPPRDGGPDPAAAAVEDLLRRHDGPFPADHARAVFRAVEAGCRPGDRADRADRDGRNEVTP